MTETKIKMLHGFAIRLPPHLSDKESQAEPFKALEDSFRAARSVIDKSVEVLAEISADQNLTALGRQAAARKFVEDKVVPTLIAAGAAIDAAEGAKQRVRDEAAAAQIDSGDVAGALLRAEIRRWFAGLDDARRNAMVAMSDQLDPRIAAALVEGPPELSAVTPEQQAGLVEHSMLALNPTLARDIGKIDGVAQATEDMARAVFNVAVREAGLNANELREALGQPTLSDRLAEITEGLSEVA